MIMTKNDKKITNDEITAILIIAFILFVLFLGVINPQGYDACCEYFGDKCLNIDTHQGCNIHPIGEYFIIGMVTIVDGIYVIILIALILVLIFCVLRAIVLAFSGLRKLIKGDKK